MTNLPPAFTRCVKCRNWAAFERWGDLVCLDHAKTRDRIATVASWLALVAAFAFPVAMYLWVA